VQAVAVAAAKVVRVAVAVVVWRVEFPLGQIRIRWTLKFL